MHHAELLIGSLTDATHMLASVIRMGSPDTRIIESERFGIAEARTLIGESAMRPIEEEWRTFIVAFKEATLEAQNALLKTLEEPAKTTRFFIVVPKEDVLLPTVRSRLMQNTIVQRETPVSEDARAFLRASYGSRLAEIAERAKVKDTAWMEDILRGIERVAEERKDHRLMHSLVAMRQYFASSGASKKMILEHLALLV
jgi:DNA polymerase III subunit delta'